MFHPVFVYGTLKSGYGNNRSLLSNATLVGDATTTDGCYGLYAISDSDAFPIMTEGEGDVRGEVWFVTDEELEDLDRLEGHPSFYTRVKVNTTLGECWGYFYTHTHGHHLNNIHTDGKVFSWHRKISSPKLLTWEAT